MDTVTAVTTRLNGPCRAANEATSSLLPRAFTVDESSKPEAVVCTKEAPVGSGTWNPLCNRSLLV